MASHAGETLVFIEFKRLASISDHLALACAIKDASKDKKNHEGRGGGPPAPLPTNSIALGGLMGFSCRRDARFY